ncbi:MAG TPA: transporter substrate-binding domain-containing protein [Arcobacter sp.]|nr:transporter substrate-binding domain-containing protein [Arcobacter sp.]
MIKNKLSVLLVLILFTINLFADRLADIEKAGVLKAGVKVDFEPFGFKSRKGKIIGFDIDMMEEIARNMGVRLELIPVTSENRIQFILDNKVDVVAASMTHRIKIDIDIDFTITYFYDGQSILANRTIKARSYKDFEDKKVGAQLGSSSGKVFEVIQPLATMVYKKDFSILVEDLKSGKIDAITSDYGFLRNIAKKSKGKLKMVGKKFTVEPYGIGLPENESNLRDALNIAIQKSVKTKKYKKIYKKWFRSNPIKSPTLWP